MIVNKLKLPGCQFSRVNRVSVLAFALTIAHLQTRHPSEIDSSVTSHRIYNIIGLGLALPRGKKNPPFGGLKTPFSVGGASQTQCNDRLGLREKSGYF